MRGDDDRMVAGARQTPVVRAGSLVNLHDAIRFDVRICKMANSELSNQRVETHILLLDGMAQSTFHKIVVPGVKLFGTFGLAAKPCTLGVHELHYVRILFGGDGFHLHGVILSSGSYSLRWIAGTARFCSTLGLDTYLVCTSIMLVLPIFNVNT